MSQQRGGLPIKLPTGGTYDRVLLCDLERFDPIVIYPVDFVDQSGKTLDEIFNFHVAKGMHPEHRLVRCPVQLEDQKVFMSVFCRVENKISKHRLDMEVVKLNGYFQGKTTMNEKKAMYKFLVDHFYEKMMNVVEYVRKNMKTGEYDWVYSEMRTTRNTPVLFPITSDDEPRLHNVPGTSVSAMVHSQMASSYFNIPPSPLKSVKPAKKKATSTPNVSLTGGSARGQFKSPVVDAAKKRPATIQATTGMPPIHEEEPGPSHRSRQSSAQSVTSESPSEILAGIPAIANPSLTEDAIDKIAAKILDRIYDVCRKASKEEQKAVLANQAELQKLVEEKFEDVRQKLDSLEKKSTSTNNKVLKDSDENSVKLAAIIESQVKLERKVKLLGNSLAEKEARAVNMVGSFLPVDEMDITHDFFFACNIIQTLILKYMQPSIHGLPLGNLAKSLANAILHKLFTQNCRAHLVVGESQNGLQNKLWCKRPIPTGVLRMTDSLVLPYMAKRVKSQTREALGLNVNLIKGKMQNTLQGDRTAYLRKAAKKTKSPADTAAAMYEEDCKFYDANEHVVSDQEKMPFNQFKTAIEDMSDVKLIFAQKAAGVIEDKPEDDLTKVFDSLKIGKGRKVDTLQEMSEFIASVATVMGYQFSEITFCDIPSIEKPTELFRSYVGGLKNMNDLVEHYEQGAQDKDSEDDDVFVQPGPSKSRRTTSAKSVSQAMSAGAGLTLDAASQSTTTSNSTSNDSSLYEVTPKKSASKKRKQVTQTSSNDDSLEDFETESSSKRLKKKQIMDKPKQSKVVSKKDSNLAKRKSSKGKKPQAEEEKRGEQDLAVITHQEPPNLAHLEQVSSGDEEDQSNNPAPVNLPAENVEPAENLPAQITSHMEETAHEGSVQQAGEQAGEQAEQQAQIAAEVATREQPQAREQEDIPNEQTEEQISEQNLSQPATRSSSRIQKKKSGWNE